MTFESSGESGEVEHQPTAATQPPAASEDEPLEQAADGAIQTDEAILTAALNETPTDDAIAMHMPESPPEEATGDLKQAGAGLLRRFAFRTWLHWKTSRRGVANSHITNSAERDNILWIATEMAHARVGIASRRDADTSLVDV